MRVLTVGVLAQLLSISFAFAFPAQFGASPDNNQSLMLSTIQSAKQTLLMNVYQWDSEKIADAVIERIQAGVEVQILIEGEPLGEISPNTGVILRNIQDAMANQVMRNPKLALNHRIFVMSGARNGKKRRFKYDHAKYVVADGQTTLVSSENFGSKGHPTPGDIGNRGWDIVLNQADLAKKMTSMFRSDTSTAFGDIISVGPHDTLPEFPRHGKSESQDHGLVSRPVPSVPSESGDVTSAELITSPNSLDPLVAMIRSAKNEIVVEHMSLPSTWRGGKADDGDDTAAIIQSPLVSELIAAARRGVKVRVLLNDERAFGANEDQGRSGSAKPNDITAKLLNDTGACERISLAGRIVDVKQVGISYIHNKGMVVDGNQVLVSSINGTKNSITNNREVAVRVQSQKAGQYYRKLFDFDWSQSAAIEANASCRNLVQ